MTLPGKVRCEQCGHETELPASMKRSIIKLYEAATGKVLLPEPGQWKHKRTQLTPFKWDGALPPFLCGEPSGDQIGELQWRNVTCQRCRTRMPEWRRRREVTP